MEYATRSRWFQFNLRRLVVATSIAGVALGLFGPEYFRAWFVEDTLTLDGYGRISIVGPATSGGFAVALPELDDQDVMRALQQVSPTTGGFLVYGVQRDSVRIVKEKIADYVDQPQHVPSLGNAQLHHAHYKCTIYFTETTWLGGFNLHAKDLTQVIYVDHNHHHRLARANSRRQKSETEPSD